jgi:hypothetical protein
VRHKALDAGLAAALFLTGVLLNAPLFMRGELPYRDSIEGGYASMTRFIAAHPHPWGWNPTQYGGLSTQFTYLPLPMYAGAAVSWVTGIEPEYAHRLLVSTFACLGPVTLFVFILYFTRSRAWAFAAAGTYVLVCPLYGLAGVIGNDRGYVQIPWRLQVLAKYGEGPHNVGLTLIPLALTGVWMAATGRRHWQLFLAAVLLAAVALTNWIAALALAICCLLLMLAGLRVPEFRVARVAGAGALAYLLACFWLTPGFVRTVAFNWPADAFGYHLRQQQWLMFGGLLAGVAAIRAVTWRREDAYLPFTLMAAFAFGWISLGFYWRGVDTLPESRRYALEFSLFLFAAGFEMLRRLRNAPARTVRVGAGLAALAVFSLGVHQARLYVTQGWARWAPVSASRTVEYRLARWIAAHPPEGRVFASGGVRFRLNSWFSIPQVGGTFESGLRSRMPLHFAYRIRTHSDSPVLLLKTLGVEYVVVNGPGSKEHYRDIATFAALDSLFERVYEEPNDWILRVPFRSYAHLVKPDELPPFLPRGDQARVLEPYVTAMEQRPLAAAWQGPGALDITGEVPPGMLVAVKVNHDPGWVATQSGEPVEVERDQLGYMILRAGPAPDAPIQLRFNSTLEQRACVLVSVVAWIWALPKLWRERRPDMKTLHVKAQGFARP